MYTRLILVIFACGLIPVSYSIGFDVFLECSNDYPNILADPAAISRIFYDFNIKTRQEKCYYACYLMGVDAFKDDGDDISYSTEMFRTHIEDYIPEGAVNTAMKYLEECIEEGDFTYDDCDNAAVFATCYRRTKELKNRRDFKAFMECSKQYPSFTMEDMQRFFTYRKFKTRQETCYYACVLKNYGILTKKGTYNRFDVHRIRTMHQKKYPAQAVRKAMKYFQKCITEDANSADQCENAVAYATCRKDTYELYDRKDFKAFMECLKQFPSFTMDDMDQLVGYRNFKTRQEKCYYACILKSYGIMTEEGTYISSEEISSVEDAEVGAMEYFEECIAEGYFTRDHCQNAVVYGRCFNMSEEFSYD